VRKPTVKGQGWKNRRMRKEAEDKVAVVKRMKKL
jgi:hypothetical protein